MTTLWRKGRGWLAGALLLAGALALWLGTERGHGGDKALARQGQRPQAQARAQPAAQRPAGRPDLTGTYALKYAMSYQGPAPVGGRAMAELNWQASWQVARLPLAEGWLGVQAKLSNWQANAALQAVSGLGDAERPALERPFAVRLGGDGQVAEVRCATDVPAPACAMLAGIAHAAQFVRPADATGPNWQVQENDLTGVFAASYKTIEGGRVLKAWTGAGVEAGHADPLGMSQLTEATFELAAGALKALRYTQTGRLQPPMDDRAAGTEFHIAVTLERQADRPAPGLAGLDPQKFKLFDSSVAELERPQAAPIDLATALQRLEKLESGHEAERRAAVRADLIAMMRADVRSVAEVKQRLVAGGLSERTERTLLEALVGTGTPLAQEVVADLITDQALGQSLRDRALVGATLLQNASESFVARLLDLGLRQPAYRSATAVALGAVAHDLAPRQPQRAGTLVATLVADAQAALAVGPVGPARHAPVVHTTLLDECNWLAALGNTGDVAALPAILAALGDPRETVRIAAAHALRFQPSAATHDAMVLRMAADESIGVRTALLHAAQIQGPKARQVMVEKALMFDLSKAVRLEAAFTVASWSVTAPGLRQLLAAALAHEKDPQVQESLRNYLTPGRIGALFHEESPAKDTP